MFSKLSNFVLLHSLKGAMVRAHLLSHNPHFELPWLVAVLVELLNTNIVVVIYHLRN